MFIYDLFFQLANWEKKTCFEPIRSLFSFVLFIPYFCLLVFGILVTLAVQFLFCFFRLAKSDQIPKTKNRTNERFFNCSNCEKIVKNKWWNYLMNSLKEQMEAAFAKFDKDKTGRINYTEFCTMLNKNNKWNTNPI